MAWSPKNGTSLKTPGFFLWWGGAVFLLFVLAALYIVSGQRSHGESEHAIAAHQRVTILLDGTIEGAAPTPAPAATEPTPAEPPAVETPAATEPPPPETSATSPAESTAPVPTPVAAATVPEPSVTIILSGLGLNQLVLDEAVKLPPAVAFAFSPYAAESQAQALDARKQGREVLVELPLESRDTKIDSGPRALLTTANEETNLANLNWALARAPENIGVLIPADDAFAGKPALVSPLVSALAARPALLFITRDKESSGWGAALDSGQLQGDDSESLDDELSAIAIDNKLADIERLARIHGHAIAVGHAYPVTVQRIAAWAEKLEAKGYTLVAPSQHVAGVKQHAAEKKAREAKPASPPAE